MFMMYYRMYTTYDMLGMIFDLDKSNVMRDIRYLEPAIKQSILIPAKKYADAKKLKTVRVTTTFFPELIVITDGTEQPAKTERSYQKNRTIRAKRKNTHNTKSDYSKS